MSENADWERLSRYLADECSDEERRQVEAWLRRNPENHELLETLRRIWDVAEQPRDEGIPTAQEMNVDRERLLKTIRKREARTARDEADRSARPGLWNVLDRLTASFPGRLVGATAAALVLFGVGVLLTFTVSEDEQTASEPVVREIATARGERATIRLADSTRVHLSVDTELRVPESFGESRREVELDGEAYFEVTSDLARPFIVRSGPARVQVLGTAFGVTAYAADSVVQVVVREGRVAFRPDEASEGSPDAPDATSAGATLGAGDLGLLSRRASRVETRPVDTAQYLSWVDDRLVFTNTPLPDVARRLERWYDVDVRLQDEALEERRLTATFESASAASVAEVIAATLGIDARVDDRTIRFSNR